MQHILVCAGNQWRMQEFLAWGEVPDDVTHTCCWMIRQCLGSYSKILPTLNKRRSGILYRWTMVLLSLTVLTCSCSAVKLVVCVGLNESAAARRVIFYRRRRRQQNGGGSGDRRRQRTENTRFSTKFKVTQSCEAMT